MLLGGPVTAGDGTCVTGRGWDCPARNAPDICKGQGCGGQLRRHQWSIKG